MMKTRFNIKPYILPTLIIILLAIFSRQYSPYNIPEEILTLKEDSILNEIKNSNGYLLVHFSSYDPNCGYCARSNPYIDKLAKQYVSRLKVARLTWEPWTDYVKSVEIETQFRIRGIPLYILYQDGQELWHGHGFTEATLEKLESLLVQCCS